LRNRDSSECWTLLALRLFDLRLDDFQQNARYDADRKNDFSSFPLSAACELLQLPLRFHQPIPLAGP
jgi:hypothetical protein